MLGVTATNTLSPWSVVGGGAPVTNANATSVAAVGTLHAGVDGCAAAEAAVAASVSAADLTEDERVDDVSLKCRLFVSILLLFSI